MVKRFDGTDLIAPTDMTFVTSSSLILKHDATSTNRTTAGEAYAAFVTAEIDGEVRSFEKAVSRDA